MNPPPQAAPSSGGFSGMVRFFSDSKITPLLILASVLLGVFSLLQLPREEEPQIVVPIYDVMVAWPGASAPELEKRIVELGERKFWEIPGVEYVYSTARPNGAMFIVRFKVGQDLERSTINLYNKIQSNFDFIPPGAGLPLVKPRSIDDVPILALTFHSARRSAVDLRAQVARLRQEINAIPNVSETTLIGGRKRQFQVFFDPAKLARRSIAPTELADRLRAANVRLPAGHLESRPLRVAMDTDGFLLSRDDLARLVVGIHAGRAVPLGEVARVTDGPDEDERAVEIRFGPAAGKNASGAHEAVTLTVAKRKGANATLLSNVILAKLTALRDAGQFPADLEWTVTRDYGHTAAEKSNELLFHMGLAIFGVGLLIAWALGLRAAGVVLIAIPVTLALTLATFHFFGFTVNRITLFALIFTIGILVDDPIVGVENIVRHLALPSSRGRETLEVAGEAIREIISPLILATLAVIAAILPMAFVGGLMGPYMRPIPIGASAAMVFSLLVSLTVTPWAALRILRRDEQPHRVDAHGVPEDALTRLYLRFMRPLLAKRRLRLLFLAGLGVLLLISVALIPLKAVRLKMLPFDNKSEFQVILDLPEGTPLERTRATLSAMAEEVLKAPEVHDVEMHVGTAAPYNFNGLVRHYFLRDQPHQGDLQVNLAPRARRKRQSHSIAESLRERLNALALRAGGHVQIAEVPPGPPVLSTLVLEIYGPDAAARDRLAREIEHRLRLSSGITDVATYVTRPEPRRRLEVDPARASLNDIPAAEIGRALGAALSGETVGLARLLDADEPVEIVLRLPREMRRDDHALASLRLMNRSGRLVPVADLVRPVEGTGDRTLYRKNLMPVSYVLADVTDRIGSPVYAILDLQEKLKELRAPDGKPLEMFFIHPPMDPNIWGMKWDGEWHITHEVFRDMGLAFAAVLVLIFVLVVGWFRSFVTPWVVMLPIPLSLVGILPAHWITGTFFTATSMIGMIAGAGIVVRNAIILVDFIELRLAHGETLEEACMDAGAIRFRPMLLTAAAVVVGASVILMDPIFQGLALSLIAGEIASTLLSRTAVPVLYLMTHRAPKRR
ncbi:MAG: efflux RND transporter permease subunit [Verrucomicrobiae bacterium]|nr:efflux RND transporter permease subunit [Verrucomicrobiae bacterium]